MNYVSTMVRGGRQFSDRNSMTSQIYDNSYYLQMSDRKKSTPQFSDTHRKKPFERSFPPRANYYVYIA